MKHFHLPIRSLLVAAIATSFARSILPQVPPYKDPAPPIDQRVADLVSRMTLEEKVSQMQNAAAAIERLGIPDTNGGTKLCTELHVRASRLSFPQAIGLAATFNENLIRQVADVTSTEASAKHHEYVRKGERGRYKGLTFWTPNINIFRDPRWGPVRKRGAKIRFSAGLLGFGVCERTSGKRSEISQNGIRP